MILAEIQTALRGEDINVLLGHKSCVFHSHQHSFRHSGIQMFQDLHIQPLLCFEKVKSVTFLLILWLTRLIHRCSGVRSFFVDEVCWNEGPQGAGQSVRVESFKCHRNHSLLSHVEIATLLMRDNNFL